LPIYRLPSIVKIRHLVGMGLAQIALKTLESFYCTLYDTTLSLHIQYAFK